MGMTGMHTSCYYTVVIVRTTNVLLSIIVVLAQRSVIGVAKPTAGKSLKLIPGGVGVKTKPVMFAHISPPLSRTTRGTRRI